MKIILVTQSLTDVITNDLFQILEFNIKQYKEIYFSFHSEITFVNSVASSFNHFNTVILFLYISAYVYTSMCVHTYQGTHVDVRFI